MSEEWVRGRSLYQGRQKHTLDLGVIFCSIEGQITDVDSYRWFLHSAENIVRSKGTMTLSEAKARVECVALDRLFKALKVLGADVKLTSGGER